jgi:hypothetical protein
MTLLSFRKQFGDNGFHRYIEGKPASLSFVQVRDHKNQPSRHTACAHKVPTDATVVSANHVSQLTLATVSTKKVNYCGAKFIASHIIHGCHSSANGTPISIARSAKTCTESILKTKEERRAETMARIYRERKSPRNEQKTGKVWERKCLCCSAPFKADSPYLRLCRVCRTKDNGAASYVLTEY